MRKRLRLSRQMIRLLEVVHGAGIETRGAPCNHSGGLPCDESDRCP